MRAPERERLIKQLHSSLHQGSRSFALASHLFGRELRERTTMLYAWCRACDDWTDGQVLGQGCTGDPFTSVPTDKDAAVRQVDASRESNGENGSLDERRACFLKERLNHALHGPNDTELSILVEQGEDPFKRSDLTLNGDNRLDFAFLALRVLVSECHLPECYLRDHLAGFASDVAGDEPATLEELLRYCYQVAGVVGCLMAVLMGVKPDNDDMLDRACDLGMAFQLTNIARDIREDASRGRCYLPADWLRELGIPRHGLLLPEYRGPVAALAARLVGLSVEYEQSARVGARRLPFRARWAVLAAAAIYGEIGREIARRGERALDDRVVVTHRCQLQRLAGALLQACRPTREVLRDGLWTRPRRSLF